MVTAVPLVLPDQPLTVLWQSTVVDIEPGSRYSYRHDAASINTTLAIANRTDAPISFPLILATTDPEPLHPSHRRVRIGNAEPQLDELVDDARDQEWTTFGASVKANAVNQGHDPVRIDAFLTSLRSKITRAYRSEQITLQPNEERFIRTHQRKLLPERDGVFEFRGIFPLPQFALATGGTISVGVAVPRSTQKFAVDLLDWTRNFSPQAFGKDPGLPLVGGRFLLAWFWQNDPELFVAYRYLSA